MRLRGVVAARNEDARSLDAARLLGAAHRIMYSFVGALIFSCYLVFDIQLLMHGKRVQLSPDDYVFAALNLYLDIVQLFLHILRLYGEMSRN